MRIAPICSGFILHVALTGCAQVPMVGRPAMPEDILVSVQSPEQTRLWRAALDKGTLPPVDAIEVPADPITDRRLAQVPETQEPRPPSLPKTVATAVIPIELPESKGGVERAAVIAVAVERLTLIVDEEQPLEIAYRTPSGTPLTGLVVEQGATVEFRPLQVTTPAHRYAFAVGDMKEQASLVVVQDSGDAPISHKFRIGDVSVRQVTDTPTLSRFRRSPEKIPPGGAPVPVRVAIGDWSTVLAPGTVLTSSQGGTDYDIVIYHSRMYPQEAQWSNTAPYSLHVALFRVSGVR